MGHKKVCFECRKAYSINETIKMNIQYVCPECGNKAIILSHRFRPPRRESIKNWKLSKFIVDHGFYFGHLSNNSGSYVKYPATMEEAKEFVMQYKHLGYFPQDAKEL